MQHPVNSTEETVMPDNLTFIVYAKKDCSYELYTDDGDGYAYENGAYTLETYMWNQSEQILRDSKGREVDRFREKLFLLMAKSQSDRVKKPWSSNIL